MKLSQLAGLVFLCLLQQSFPMFAEEAEAPVFTLPGSDKRYTEKQINDYFNVPDWYPDDHIPMPEVVSKGARPAVLGCASCHLTSGSGHPESSALSGLPVEYHVRQMQAYRKFQRSSIIGVMNTIARAMTDEQIREAAEYFAALPPLDVQEVREVEEVPLTYVNPRFMRLLSRGDKSGMEKIGERLITVPVDEYRITARDPYGTFITYVPMGTLALGRKLVHEGREDTAPCTSCHGADMRGSSIGPPVAGQHASYLRAQLRAYKEGSRRGEADPGSTMAANMKYFTDWEILAAAAYVASMPRAKPEGQ